MAKYLVTFSDTLNEIEITGFVTMTDKEFEKYEELATSITWDFSFVLGNFSEGDEEGTLYFSSGEDLLTRIDTKEISNDEYKTLKKVFNNDFGVFITEDFLQNLASDIEENEIDENDEEDDRLSINDDDY